MVRVMMVALAVVVGSVAWAKDGRTYYDDETMARAANAIQTEEWARGSVESAEASARRWVQMSDEELWDFVPPPTQLRAINVAFGVGCPEHGAQIFREGGHYPWILDPDKPFKVTCPVGGESYPSNDFEPWNLQSLEQEPERGRPIVDHGAGWVDEEGNRYFFVAYYTFWQRWRAEVDIAVSALGRAYLLTDDPIYARKAAILLARVAEYYTDYHYPSQAYHSGRMPGESPSGRVRDRIWMNGMVSGYAPAYDAIYPGLDDPELRAFLAARGIDDPARHIEQRMLAEMAKDVMSGLIHGNTGMYQRSLATLAIVLDNDDPDYGPTTEQMREWIMTGDGETEYLLWNGFYRDGHGGESSPGYSSGWCINFYLVASLLPKLGVDIWSNPKLKKMADIGLDLQVAGANCPSIGDTGNILGAGRVGWHRNLQGRAFDYYGDPRHAQALAIMGASAEDLFETYYDPAEVEAVVAEVGTEMDYRTRNLGGYGLAVLESGEPGSRRGVSMYYGYAGGGHGHWDRLTLEMQAFGRPMLTEMGYPAHWGEKAEYWSKNTVSHYAVVVDQHRQETMNRAFLNTVAWSPEVHLMDAEAAHAAYPSTCSMYRRTTALIDTDPESSYLLDIFRVDGGFQHDYSFHGPPFGEFTVAGGEPGPVQTEGTLMGEDVQFGGTPPVMRGRGGATALQLQQARGVIADGRGYRETGKEGWAAYRDSQVLTDLIGATMTIDLPEPLEPGAWKLFLRVHDYNNGSVALGVRVGERTEVMGWESSGAVGPRWISQVFEIDAPAREIAITANEVGQPWALIVDAAITDNVHAEQPRLVNPRTSGFQYLFNVRRMQPDGTWSATWRDPDEDLALTMWMPGECAGEVILADAEAELKPRHPDTLQYVLARNELPEESGGSDLASTYIAVAEPHRGDAKVRTVERMEAVEAAEHATAVTVRRAGAEDLIHSAVESDADCVWRDGEREFAATGEFALVTLEGDEVSRACLINGTRLRVGAFELTAGASPTGQVLGVDHETNTIVLDGALPVPEAAIDRVLLTGNELHQTSYTIVEAEVADGRTTLGFGDTLMLVQMGPVLATDDAAGTVTLDKLGRVDGRDHQGRWLLNEDMSTWLRITQCRGNVFTVEGADRPLDEIFTDVDGDGRRQFWVSDIGPGDTWRLPAVTFVERVRPNLYRVDAMTEVTLSVPRE
ncbi:MAG: heparinase II/III domain-containing protein [Armatimonadota bacterium]